jgi:TRAP-type C4-dicarboxylate transport system permease small subunit
MILKEKWKKGCGFVIGILVFIFTIFIGWIIFDFVKHKQIKKENVLTAFVSAVIAGVVYYILYWVF